MSELLQRAGPVAFAPFRRFCAWLLGRRLVVLVDHDGEMNVRIERYDALGYPRAVRFGFGISSVHLLADGTTSGESFVKRWITIADYRRDQ